MKLITTITFISFTVIYSADLCAGDDDPKTIEQFVEMVRTKNREGLQSEHSDILFRFKPSIDYVKAQYALAKNRHRIMFCISQSRVILSLLNNDPTTDYIHANFVDGHKQPKAYIATQGPLPGTVEDFWRMIWEQQCLVIVMLTKVKEQDTVKCVEYWKNKVNDDSNYLIKTTHIDSNVDYTVTSLEITDSKANETRKVSHWQFTSWPDHRIPENTLVLFDFLEKVHIQQNKMVKDLGDKWSGPPGGPPIVVHCSIGAGRTGTFMALDISRLRLKDDGMVDIKGTVKQLRSQRAQSVYACDQYVYCNLAIIEYALSHGLLKSADLTGFRNPIWISEFVEVVRARGRSGLVKEYSEIVSRQLKYDFVDASSNTVKNRDKSVCYIHSRVSLSTENNDPTTDYIHANFVEGYEQEIGYIATQGPLSTTFNDFWRMVWEQHCLVIVMITKVKENKIDKNGATKYDFVECGQYWKTEVNGDVPHGHYHIKTTHIDSKDNYKVTSLELTNSKTKETRKVSHWQFISWPDHGVPKNSSAMLRFLDNVRDHQSKMVEELGDKWSGDENGPPIVVHCSSGIGSGTIITLDMSLLRLKQDEQVDIKATTEMVRSQRAESIQTADQYVFCHLAVIDYAVSHGIGNLSSVDLTSF